jgi:hypothetical protein
MLVFAYLLAVMTVGWSLAPDTGDIDPTARQAFLATLLYLPGWIGVGLAWASDVLLSRRGESGATGLKFGRLSLFHGPVITAVLLGSCLISTVTIALQ